MHSLHRFLLTLPVLAAAVAAQGTNVRLLSHIDKFPGGTSSNTNDAGVWGMVVGGCEYALIAARTGTIIYDCTNPTSPVEKGFIAGSNGGAGYMWREVNSYGNIAYVSSEHANAQMINMNNPNAPALAGTFGGTAHTVSVDPGAGTLWLNGGSFYGSGIYSLTSNPLSPAFITSYSSQYVHDSLPTRGFCYLAEIFSGDFRILDVRNLPLLLNVSSTTTPGQFTHNVWVTDDDRTAITADENSGGCLTVYDISNKAAPVQRSTWCSPAGATVHNVFIKGQVAHFSSYTAGYYAVDISETNNPRLIGQYDTSTFTGSGYEGCWGCYPFQPSGVIYLSDMQTGLWVVEPTCGVPLLYGTGTAGTGGLVPAIDYGGGFAKVGRTTFKVTGQRIRASTQVALILGAGQAQVSALGIQVLVNLALPTVVLAGATDASGNVSFPVPIQNSAGLANATFYAQIVSADPNGPRGLAASPGMKLTVCP